LARRHEAPPAILVPTSAGVKQHVSMNATKIDVRALDAAVRGGRVFMGVLQVIPNLQNKVEACDF
jgi:hypothetical protein